MTQRETRVGIVGANAEASWAKLSHVPAINGLWPAVKLTDTGEESLRETADHVGALGKTRSGAVFTADVGSGVAPEDARFSFEIRGSEGWLSLTSDHPYGFQAARGLR